MGWSKAITVLCAACLLSGCSEGRDQTLDQTRAYFDGHERALKALMRKVEGCRPAVIESAHRAGIWLSDNANYLYCGNEAVTADASLDHIKADMRKLEVIGLDYRFDDKGTLTRADFFLYRDGLGMSGRALSIVYLKAPGTLDGAKALASDDGKTELVGRFLLKSGADNWYWDRSVD